MTHQVTHQSWADYAQAAQTLLQSVNPAQVEAFTHAMVALHKGGKRLFVCGNGGSGANASHFGEDLSALMLAADPKRPFAVRALTDATALIMAIANDNGYDQIFARQLAMEAQPGDGLLCLSGSGNSPNVLRATEWAHQHGMQTFALTGFEGGALHRMTKLGIHVASSNMGLVEGVHLLLLDFISKDVRYAVHGIAHHER